MRWFSLPGWVRGIHNSARKHRRELLVLEYLEDRCVPSIAVPIDLAGLDGTGLFSDAIFQDGQSETVKKALAGMHAAHPAAGNASTPITGNEVASSPGTPPSAIHPQSAFSQNPGPIDIKSAPGPQATTFTVTTTADSGAGSLRAAVDA